jgi:hypothetical protein
LISTNCFSETKKARAMPPSRPDLVLSRRCQNGAGWALRSRLEKQPIEKLAEIKMSKRQLYRSGFLSIPLFWLVTLHMNCPFVLSADAQTCGGEGVAVQVLGSGGPELEDKRASSSYLVWQEGRARVLVDAGGGSALRFGESGAKMSQLDVILFTHFHVDHSADFPALIFSSWFEERDRPLPVVRPSGQQRVSVDGRFCARSVQ